MSLFIVFLVLSIFTTTLLVRVTGLRAEVAFLVIVVLFSSFIQKGRWRSEERLVRQIQDVSLIQIGSNGRFSQTQ